MRVFIGTIVACMLYSCGGYESKFREGFYEMEVTCLSSTLVSPVPKPFKVVVELGEYKDEWGMSPYLLSGKDRGGVLKLRSSCKNGERIYLSTSIVDTILGFEGRGWTKSCGDDSILEEKELRGDYLGEEL